MVKATCGASLIDKERVTDLVEMLGLNKAKD